jgi:hypothetical protein
MQQQICALDQKTVLAEHTSDNAYVIETPSWSVRNSTTFQEVDEQQSRRNHHNEDDAIQPGW